MSNDTENITEELIEIRRMISSGHMIDVIRKEVHNVMQDTRAVVVGGRYSNSPAYDVVVVHNSGTDGNKKITRRLKKAMKDIEIKEIDSMVKNILGIRYVRRGRHNAIQSTETPEEG